MADQVDYDLHGFVGIRLQRAATADVAAVDRQLGPIRSRLDREPDIVIDFVGRRWPTTSRVQLLGLNEAAFADDEFWVKRPGEPGPPRVAIDFERVGRPVVLRCMPGTGPVPFLIAIINLTALAKGYVPLHASAFGYRGRGALITGWAKGGKTEMLLAFMANGAEYIGDEWIYLHPAEPRAYGIPEPIRLWDWHLQQLPAYRARMSAGDMRRLRLMRRGTRVVELASRLSSSGPIGSLLRRLVPAARRQLSVQVPPTALFGEGACRLEGALDRLFFVVSQEADRVEVEPVDAGQITRRMVFSLRHERAELLDAYDKFRFAYPERRNPLIDSAEELERELLQRAMSGLKAYAVYHPYPVPIAALFEATAPLLADG